MVRWLISSGPLGVRSPGGTPTRSVADFVAAVAAALVEQGDAVRLLFTGRVPNAFEIPWLEEHKLSWTYWGDARPTTVRHARVLDEALRSWHPDAVMFEFGAVSLGLTCSWARGIPVRMARYLTAMQAMHHDSQHVSRAKIWRRRLVYRCATHVAVNARSLVDEVTRVYRVPVERVLLQLQGVHRPPDPPLPFGQRSRELVCVGRLAPTKGQHVLIEALGRLRRRGLDIRTHFIGDGDGASLRKQATLQGVADLCMFHGAKSRAEVYAYLCRHAIAVQPSLSDALPQSAQEAVVCGAVLVASKVGGIPDIVRDGESGVLVPPGQAGALADALDELLRNRARLEMLSAGAIRASDRVAMERRAPLEAARLRRLAMTGPASFARHDREIPE